MTEEDLYSGVLSVVTTSLSILSVVTTSLSPSQLGLVCLVPRLALLSLYSCTHQHCTVCTPT